MPKTKHNWNKLKAEFISGSTIKEISEKYNVSLGSLKSRHRRDNWSSLRMKNEVKVNEEITNKTSKKQAQDAYDEIKSIHKSLNKIDELVDSGNIEAYSLEGLLDKKAKLLQVLGTYTKKTSEQVNHSGLVQVTPIFGDMKLNVKQE